MNTEGTKQTPPTKEEIKKFYEEQIEIAEFRKKLATLNAEISEAEARRIEAIARAAHFSKPPQTSSADGSNGMPPGVVDHIVTQEDLDNNPELVAEGIKVGDHIGITNQPVTTEKADARIEPQLSKVED